MVQGVDQLDQMRRSRTSLVVLAISLGGLYYSTQIMLNYQPTPWWANFMAAFACLLLVIGLVLSFFDWQRETEHWDKIIEGRKAETENLRGEGKGPDEETTPADTREESDNTPYAAWEALNK